MAAADTPEIPQGLVAGKYRLTRLLGRGGMGAVFEGVHDGLGTRVAVKFIDTEHAASEDVRQRFVNEAKAAARLRSKHVVQVYDQGVSDDSRPYIVMEFLSGEPLDARLDRLGTLSPAETARIVLHVCRALAKAHESGIVHRDLKPENVFIVHDEEDRHDIAKVVDFGIAKFTDPGATGSSSTRTGAVLGTPQYMSPEQARGLRTVDHRTDLWSLGVIVYQCLVGSLPFKGEAVGDLLVNVCTADAPLPSSVNPSVPPGFDAWSRRALAREPAERFQTAGELCDSLAEVCGVDLRLGPASAARSDGATRVEWPGASGASGGASRAVTEGSFAGPKPAREARSKGPALAALAALFLVVVVGTVVGARALFGGSAEPANALSPVPAPSPSASAGEGADPGAETAAAAPVAPNVSPAVTANPVGSAAPPASAEASRASSGPKSGAARTRGGTAAAPPKVEKPAQPGKPGSGAPGAAKPDLLGY